MNGISLKDITSGSLSQETAELIWKIANSDMTDEQKDRAYQSVENCASITISDCSVTMKDAEPRLTIWQWLGITK